MATSYHRGVCGSFFLDINEANLTPLEVNVYNALPQKVKNCLIVKPYFIIGQREILPGVNERFFDRVSFVYSCPGRLYILDARDSPCGDNFVDNDIEYYPIRSLSDIPTLPLVGASKEMGSIGAETLFWGKGDLIAAFELLRKRCLIWNRVKDYDLIDIDVEPYSNEDGDFCKITVCADREAFRIPLQAELVIRLLVSKEGGFVSVLAPGEPPIGGRIVHPN